MSLCRFLPLAGLLLSASVPALATEPVTPRSCNLAVESCSTPDASVLPDSPDAPIRNTPEPVAPILHAAYRPEKPPTIHPFGALAIAVKVGVEGVGFDIATPVSKRINLRGGASFFAYSPDFDTDGLHVDGDIKLRAGSASVDFFPFAGSFHLSPGVTFYNGNHIVGSVTVPGNSSFDLNDQTYVSSPDDPLVGFFDVNFGNKVAPRLTAGFGNMIPRKGGHFSVPFEFGFEYLSTPRVRLSLSGSACQQGVCQPVATDPETQANVRGEQDELNSDLSPLRFYPILSIGFGYKF